MNREPSLAARVPASTPEPLGAHGAGSVNSAPLPRPSPAQAGEGGNRASPMLDWPLWEVFLRSKQGLDHRHVGSLHAADAKQAVRMARDVYTRRMEGVSIWVVPSQAITASDPGDKAEMFDPMADKVYRHPTFYKLPKEVEHM